jgi:hypothetical protein
MYQTGADKLTLKKVLFPSIALVLILGAVLVLYPEIKKSAAVIQFQDKELERLMRSALDIRNRDIVAGDIDDIEVVDVVGCYIQMKKTTGPYFGDKVEWHGGNYYVVNGVRYTDAERGKLITLADFKQFPHLKALMIEYQDNPETKPA